MSECRRGRFVPKDAPVRRRLGYDDADDAEAGPSGLQPPVCASLVPSTHAHVHTPKKKSLLLPSYKRHNDYLTDDRIQELLIELFSNTIFSICI